MRERIAASGSFCSWVIAREYYDGPIEGIGLRARDQATVFFRAVAWDGEQWSRVFAVATVRPDLVDRLRAQLSADEEPKEPFWLPGRATDADGVLAAWEAVRADAQQEKRWSLVESHDLVDVVQEMVVPNELILAVDRLVADEHPKDIDGGPMLSSLIRELRRFGSGG
jgi:hypothetical protein